MFFFISGFVEKNELEEKTEDCNTNTNNLGIDDALDKCSMGSSCVSPVSSQGGVYSVINFRPNVSFLLFLFII